MRRNIVIISVWLDTQEKILDAIQLISNVKKHFPICLYSHFPIPEIVQNMVDFSIYDKENVISKESDFDDIDPGLIPYYYAIYPGYKYINSSASGPIVACLAQTMRPLPILKMAGYTHFFFLEGDHLISEKDMRVFYDFINKGKKGTFIKYSPIMISEPFYYCEIDFFLNNIPIINTIKEFKEIVVKQQTFLLGSIILHGLEKGGLEHINFIDCHDNHDIFPNSILNKYLRSRPYNYIFDVVRDKNSSDVYFCVDVNDQSGIGIKFKIASDLHTEEIITRENKFIFKKIPSDTFLFIEIFNQKGEKIEEKLYRTEEILKTQRKYIEIIP